MVIFSEIYVNSNMSGTRIYFCNIIYTKIKSSMTRLCVLGISHVQAYVEKSYLDSCVIQHLIKYDKVNYSIKSYLNLKLRTDTQYILSSVGIHSIALSL